MSALRQRLAYIVNFTVFILICLIWVPFSLLVVGVVIWIDQIVECFSCGLENGLMYAEAGALDELRAEIERAERGDG